MNYIVWGVGKAATRFLEVYINCYFFYNPIIAFVDNDVRKVGQSFYGRKIIAPNEISEYQVDAILICCNDIESIRNQIRYLNLDVTILTLKSIYGVMYDFFYEEKKINNSKIIMIGNKEYQEINLSRTYMFSDVTYISVNQTDKLKVMKFDYIICTSPWECCYTGNTESYSSAEYALIDILVNIGICRGRILTSSVTRIYWSIDKHHIYGEENADKVFLLIRPGVIAGLGAIVLQVMRNVIYAKKNGMIPVIDMESFKNNYISNEEIGKVNGWEKFFMQPDGWHVEEIQKSKNVIESMANRQEVNIEYEDIEQYLIACPILEEEVREYLDSFFSEGKRILGVKVRGSDYVNVKPYNHCIQPDIDMVIEVVKEKYVSGNYDKIYICTEEEEVVKLFEREFSENVFYHSAARVNANLKGYLPGSSYYDDRKLYRVGADYWVELCALAHCDALIAGDCSGTRVALLLNHGEYEDVFIFNLGRYGIDDKIVSAKGAKNGNKVW